MRRCFALTVVLCALICSIMSLEVTTHLGSLSSKHFPKGTYKLVSSTDPNLKGLKTEFNFGDNNKLNFRECNIFNCRTNIFRNNLSVKFCFGTKMFCRNSKEYDLVNFLNGVDKWSKNGSLYDLKNANGKILSLKYKNEIETKWSSSHHSFNIISWKYRIITLTSEKDEQIWRLLNPKGVVWEQHDNETGQN